MIMNFSVLNRVGYHLLWRTSMVCSGYSRTHPRIVKIDNPDRKFYMNTPMVLNGVSIQERLEGASFFR